MFGVRVPTIDYPWENAPFPSIVVELMVTEILSLLVTVQFIKRRKLVKTSANHKQNAFLMNKFAFALFSHYYRNPTFH